MFQEHLREERAVMWLDAWLWDLTAILAILTSALANLTCILAKLTFPSS